MTGKRSIQNTLKSRLKEENPLIQVVIGPRQVGKTTAIKASLPKGALYISADSPESLSFQDIQEWWQKAESAKVKILAIDEIQKISGWSEMIKKLWDQNSKNVKLILSGSAALTIEKLLHESLAGRFEVIFASHWNYHEAHEILGMSMEQFIEHGCYPGSVRFLNDLERWSDYIKDSIIEPVIGKDLLHYQPIENPALFRQVFILATQYAAQIVSLNKLQGQLQDRGAIATVQNYINLFGFAFLVTGVQKYSASMIRTKKSSPKLIVHDNSFLRVYERPVHQRLKKDKLGRYFENAIGARLIEAKHDVYYWKDRDQEVDFIVLTKGGQKLAIEVKSSTCKMSDLKSLMQFCKLYSEFEPCLVSLVGQKIEGIKSISAEEILSDKL